MLNFQLEIIVFYGFIFIIRNGIDFKNTQGLNKRNKFFKAEITHIEIGKLFTQQVTQGA